VRLKGRGPSLSVVSEESTRELVGCSSDPAEPIEVRRLDWIALSLLG